MPAKKTATRRRRRVVAPLERDVSTVYARGVDPAVSAGLADLAGARGWTLATTLERLLALRTRIVRLEPPTMNGELESILFDLGLEPRVH